ncbi:YeeE/YedE family protein [Roseomonas sp. USHLN139]|uniref:YeeE/YedE family protein n=1 Tax=Roseomonas sp. USHLN139 TaxID=3081298 RepID=UPI003B015A81
MENFTPGSAALGGALIGLSVALLWLANGRIAGISGILGGLLRPQPGEWAWRLAFLAGLLAAPLAWAAIAGRPAVQLASTPLILVAAGLLVGFGARLGGGCTSGHGVAGLARGSRRSLLATALFMLTAALTVFAMRHLLPG